MTAVEAEEEVLVWQMLVLVLRVVVRLVFAAAAAVELVTAIAAAIAAALAKGRYSHRSRDYGRMLCFEARACHLGVLSRSFVLAMVVRMGASAMLSGGARSCSVAYRQP